MDLGTWEYESSHPGWRYIGQDRTGTPIWEIIPELQPITTQIINWKDPLTQHGFGTEGLDPGLASYLGESEAQKEQYKIDEAELLSELGIVKDSLADKIAEQANVQSGGFGLGFDYKQPGAAANKLPVPLFILFVIIWFYK